MKFKKTVLSLAIGLMTIGVANAQTTKVEVPQTTSPEIKVQGERHLLEMKKYETQDQFDKEVAELENSLKNDPSMLNKMKLFSAYVSGGMNGFFNEKDPRWSQENIEKMFLGEAKKDNPEAQMMIATFYLMDGKLDDSFKWAWMANDNPNGAYPIQSGHILRWVTMLKNENGETIVPVMKASDDLFIQMRPHLKDEYLKKMKENRARQEDKKAVEKSEKSVEVDIKL